MTGPGAGPGAGPGPTVSVVTPVWNAEATLGETVASVLAQTRGDWELLLVDDGSRDSSRALAARLAAGDPRIRLLGWDNNRGAAAARNAGIRAGRGRFLAFLDADDLWEPEKLAVQIGYMEREAVPFSFAAYRRIDADGRPLGRVGVPLRVDHARLLAGNVVPCLTAVYDRLHFGRVEMPDLRRRQDYGLWLRLLAQGGEAHGIDRVLAAYRVRQGSLSSRRLVGAAATWRVYREVVGLGRPRAAWCLAQNLARGVAKRMG